LDAPACCGGGVGGFAWFDDQAAMFTFVHDYFAWAPLVLDDSNQLHQELGVAVQALFEDEVLLEHEAKLREAFNEAFKTKFQIRWWGPFSSLLRDEDDFAAELRRSFWEEHDPSGDSQGDSEAQSRPIPAESLPSFVEFIRYWGI
jgi:hypothetical protein